MTALTISGFRNKLHLILLSLVAFLAVLPLTLHGPSCGHDFDFHLLSWFEAATQIAHGNLHPHWAFTPAWNAGEPRFVFYPPITWYVGAVLGLILPWTWTPIVFTGIALAAAGLACHRLLRAFVPPATALFVSALYIVNPYMLFTAYERTAYAELLCAAWLPLLLLGILRPRVTLPGIAVPLALLWLTNAPAAVLGTYSLALLTLVRLLQNRVSHHNRVPHLRDSFTVAKVGSTELAATTATGTTLGLGLAAFYIVPAAYERRYVEIALVKAQSLLVTANFLFGHTADSDHDAVLYTASLIAVLLLALAAAALLTAFLRNKDVRPTLISLAALTAVIAFLLASPSTPIWLHAPQLAFLQFPWRFLAILAPTLALVLALALRQLGPMMKTAITLLIIGSQLSGYQAFHQSCDSEDTPTARLALFHSSAGTDPTDEYTPNTADEDSLGHASPPFWLAPTADAPPPPNATPGPLHTPLELTTPTSEVLILNRRSYPSWHLFLNHQLVTDRLERPDGLLAIPLSAGHSVLTLAYVRTPDQTAGEIVSAISLAVLLYLLYRRRR